MKAIALTHYLPSDHPHCFIETELPESDPGPAGPAGTGQGHLHQPG